MKPNEKTIIRQSTLVCIVLWAIVIMCSFGWKQDYAGAPIHSAARLIILAPSVLMTLLHFAAILLVRHFKGHIRGRSR